MNEVRKEHTEEEPKEIHLAMRCGSVKALEYKLNDCKIKKLRRRLKEIIRKCETCQRSGKGNIKKQITAVKTNRINELWEIDLVGLLKRSRDKYSYLLTMIDHFSKGEK